MQITWLDIFILEKSAIIAHASKSLPDVIASISPNI